MLRFQFKDYIFANNPRAVEVSYQNQLKTFQSPFGLKTTHNFGAKQRIVRCEGEFFGTDALTQFERMKNSFTTEGAGLLYIPANAPFYAYLSSLKLVGEASPNLIRYAFELVEA